MRVAGLMLLGIALPSHARADTRPLEVFVWTDPYWQAAIRVCGFETGHHHDSYVMRIEGPLETGSPVVELLALTVDGVGCTTQAIDLRTQPAGTYIEWVATTKKPTDALTQGVGFVTGNP